MCQSDRVRPVNPLWYLAAFLLVLGGWMAGTVVAAGSWNLVRDATLGAVDERVDAAGGSVAVFTDVLQPERDVTCRATPKAEGDQEDDDVEPIDVPAAPDGVLGMRIDRAGTDWFLIGFLAEGRDGLAVTCTPRDRAADNATYRVAAVDGVLDRARTGSGVTWLATAAGLALAAWTWWCRRSRNEEA